MSQDKIDELISKQREKIAKDMEERKGRGRDDRDRDFK